MPQWATDDAGGSSARSAPRLIVICNLLGAAFCAASLAGSLPYWPGNAGACAVAAGYLALAFIASRLLARFPKHAGWFCMLLAALALMLRLAWALTAHSPPQDDYGDYRSAALDALHGDWYALQHTFWPWGNTLWLYVIARLFGPSLESALVANALVATATTVLIYAAGRRLVVEPAARAGAVLYALCPAPVYWGSLFCAEIPHLFLFLAGFLCLLTGLDLAREHRRPGSQAPALPSRPRFSGSPVLVAGGLLLAAADFFRPVSPLLLVPMLLFASMRGDKAVRERVTESSKRARDALFPLGGYVVGVAAFLVIKSLVTGYPNLTPSYTLGMNLACGLNWRTRGTWNAADDRVIMVSDDPRIVNRAGLHLARERLGELLGRERSHLLMLPIRKFPLNWSSEREAYYANADAIPAERRARHWLIRYEAPLRATLQLGHVLIVVLAGVGFWRCRRSGRLAMIGAIITGFALFHTVVEVQDRYHFAVEALLVAAAGAALLTSRSAAEVRSRDPG